MHERAKGNAKKAQERMEGGVSGGLKNQEPAQDSHC